MANADMNVLSVVPVTSSDVRTVGPFSAVVTFELRAHQGEDEGVELAIYVGETSSLVDAVELARKQLLKAAQGLVAAVAPNMPLATREAITATRL